MANVTQRDFATALLNKLGYKPTKQNVRAIVGWENAEGGNWNNSAKYNPLNTTQPMPGAGNTGSQGNIKVYRDWQQGVNATAKTLTNGRYEPILSALAKGTDATAVANAIGQTPWGTSGDLVQRTIAGTPAQSASGGLNVSSTPRAATPKAPKTQTVTTPGVDNSGQRQALVSQYLTSQ